MIKINDDDKPINCPRCGAFMKETIWINENSGEQSTFKCNKCGNSFSC